MDRYDELASAWAKDQGWAEDEAYHEKIVVAHALKWNNERHEKETCEWRMVGGGFGDDELWESSCGISRPSWEGPEETGKCCPNCGRRIVEVKDE